MTQLRDYIYEFESDSTFEIAVVGSQIPQSIKNMVGKVFGENDVKVYEEQLEGVEEELVLFKDREIVATSPLTEVSESLLMVNSDFYRTGTIELNEITTPNVIKQLQGERFLLKGYPKSNYEKLMLILISRHIEKLSRCHDNSTHRASFQRLSRIKDEKGTHRIYQKLSENNSEVHIYGKPDWIPPVDWGLTVHKDSNNAYTDYWFVVHRSPKKEMALLAVQETGNTWEALWTMDPTQVKQIEQYIITEFD